MHVVLVSVGGYSDHVAIVGAALRWLVRVCAFCAKCCSYLYAQVVRREVGVAFTQIVAQANRSGPAAQPPVTDPPGQLGISPADTHPTGTTWAKYRLTSSNWPSTEATMTGTVSISLGSDQVDGVGTLFTSQLIVGDMVNVGGAFNVVRAISSDTLMFCERVFGIARTAITYTKRDFVRWATDRSDDNGTTWVQIDNGDTPEGALARDGSMPAATIMLGVQDQSGVWQPSDHSVQVRVRYGIHGTLRFGIERDRA